MDRAKRLRRSALRTPGLQSIPRPVTDDPHTGTFDLSYVRTRPALTTADAESRRVPVVVIPGGPGLASAVPYRKLRDRAAATGLDLVMVEHRGIGLSRHDREGNDLPPAAMRIRHVVDDIAAVLRAEGIQRAVIAGSSYGTYVAQAFAATHPEVLAGVLLDSPMIEADDRPVVDHARALLLHGTVGTERTRVLAAKIRSLLEDGAIAEETLGQHVRIVFEFAGPVTLGHYLDQLKVGRAKRTGALLDKLGGADTGQGVPYVMEGEVAFEIAFRELDAFGTGDGRIFDQRHEFTHLADRYSAFAGDPYDLPAALTRITVPVLVLCGDQDLRTPLPVGRRIAELAPHGLLVEIPEHGHSALDTRSEAFLVAAAALAEGDPAVGKPAVGQQTEGEPAGAQGTAARSLAERIVSAPTGGGPSTFLGPMIRATLTLDRILSRSR